MHEYWRFDATGDDYYPISLAGKRLVEGEYQPILIEHTAEGWHRGHSETLNLSLCWVG